MSTVAFLASVVDPRVASSAAKSAMEEFAKIKDEVPSSLVEQHLGNVIDKAVSEGKDPAPDTDLGKSGIAGTDKAPVQEPEAMDTTEEKEGKDDQDKENSEEDERKKSQKERLKVSVLDVLSSFRTGGVLSRMK